LLLKIEQIYEKIEQFRGKKTMILKESIKSKGLKQKQLALESGIKPDFMNQIILGKRKPTPEVLKIFNKYNLLIDIIQNVPITEKVIKSSSKPGHNYKDLYDQWIANLEYKKRSNKTLAGYAGTVLPLIQHLNLNTATKKDLENYVIQHMKKSSDSPYHQGWNESSANRNIREWQAFTNWLEKNDLITHDENFVNKLEFIKEPKHDKPTAKVEAYKEAFNADTNLQHRLVMTLAFETGMRRSELATAKISDINWRDRTITIIGKGNKQRHPMFGSNSEALLKQWLEVKKNRPQSKRNLGREKNIFDMGESGIAIALRKVGQKIGKKINPHSFRRGLTFSLLDQGVDLNDVKEILGHEDIKTTLLYSKEYGEKQAQRHYKSPLDNIGLPTLNS
jgi:site-specific recombinase XerD